MAECVACQATKASIKEDTKITPIQVKNLCVRIYLSIYSLIYLPGGVCMILYYVLFKIVLFITFLLHFKVTQPFELLGMDLIGKLTRTDSGHQYICVMIDYMTKWPQAYPLKSKSAAEVTNCIIKFFLPV